MGGDDLAEKNYTVHLRFLYAAAAAVLAAGLLFSVAVPLLKKRPAADVLGEPEAQTLISNSLMPEIIKTRAPETYDSLSENLLRLRYEFPALLESDIAGFSASGRVIPMLKLGTGDKKALFIGAVHAREHISTKYLLCCIESYCKAFYSESGMLGDYDIRALLSEYTLYIVPCANPDGLEIIGSRDRPADGVRVTALNEYKANKNGVDINRNFPLAWNEIKNGVGSPADYYFKGYAAASEPETAALMKLCTDNSFEFAISVHIKGNCIYWGDTFNTALNPAYEAYASKIADACALYMPLPTLKATDYGGGFENWFRHTFSRPGFCVELIDNKNLIVATDATNYSDFYKTVNYGKTVFLAAAAMRG